MLRQREAKKFESPLLSLMREARASGTDSGMDVMKDSKANDMSNLVKIGVITTVTTATSGDVTTDDDDVSGVPTIKTESWSRTKIQF